MRFHTFSVFLLLSPAFALAAVTPSISETAGAPLVVGVAFPLAVLPPSTAQEQAEPMTEPLVATTVIVQQTEPNMAPEPTQPLVFLDNSPYAVELRRLDDLAPTAVPIRAQPISVAIKALANAAGMQYIAPSEDDFKELVTVRAAGNPWKILSALKDKFGFDIEFQDGLWTFYKPVADEIIVRTYQLRFNDLSSTTITAPTINTGIGSGSTATTTGGSSGGSGGASGDAFDIKADNIVSAIQELLKLTITGADAVVASNGFVADLPDLPPSGYSLRLASLGAKANAGSFVKLISANNRLVVGAPRQSHNYIAEYLKSVDRPQRQMMVRVLFVETSASDQADLGINTTAGANLKLGMNGTSTFPLNNPLWNTPTGTILNTATLDMQLKALQTAGQAQIYNRAMVVCINNEPTQFNSGLKIPILNSSTATPSSAGSQTTQSIQYIDIGIDTRILARLLDDSQVGAETMRLNLALTITAQSGNTVIGGQPYPIVSERKYALPALVRNGETLVIGGLVATTDSRTDSKLPGIGSVPVVGWLFKSKSGTKERRTLTAYITPILDPAPSIAPEMKDPFSKVGKIVQL